MGRSAVRSDTAKQVLTNMLTIQNSSDRGVSHARLLGGSRLPVHPSAQRLLTMIAATRTAGPSPSSVEDRRRALANLMRLAGPPPQVASVDEAWSAGPAGPIALRIYSPRRGSEGPLPGLVYFHGGGLVAGSLDTHDPLCRVLCDAIGCRVVAVAYRLAPEHPFPAAVEDADAAVGHVLRHAAALRLDPGRIAIGGDSAGGTLAAVTAQARRGAGVFALLLLCPVLDAAAETESRRSFGEGFLLDRTLMMRDLADYAPGATNLADPRVSPLRARDLAAMPRTFIHTAECDPVRDEGRAYAERLAGAGVEVRHTCHAGMIHHFYGLSSVIPRAGAILAEIGAEMRDAFVRPD